MPCRAISPRSGPVAEPSARPVGDSRPRGVYPTRSALAARNPLRTAAFLVRQLRERCCSHSHHAGSLPAAIVASDGYDGAGGSAPREEWTRWATGSITTTRRSGRPRNVPAAWRQPVGALRDSAAGGGFVFDEAVAGAAADLCADLSHPGFGPACRSRRGCNSLHRNHQFEDRADRPGARGRTTAEMIVGTAQGSCTDPVQSRTADDPPWSSKRTARAGRPSGCHRRRTPHGLPR